MQGLVTYRYNGITMNSLEQQLAQAVSASFAKYNSHGPRSPEKLKPLHGFVAAYLASIFGSAYKLHYLGNITQVATG